jgi:SAM-dependent methyltransferase
VAKASGRAQLSQRIVRVCHLVGHTLLSGISSAVTSLERSLVKSLNLGCGLDYHQGWINVDRNREVRADVYLELRDGLPFATSSFDLVLLDNTLEHIPKSRLIRFLEEIHRVCKPAARVRIYAPHYSGMYAFKHLTHYSFFGVGTFDLFHPEPTFNGERYSRVRFRTLEERLLFFHHNLSRFRFLSRLPINFLFNVCRPWRQLMERFQFLGFDEIYYELEVVK